MLLREEKTSVVLIYLAPPLCLKRYLSQSIFRGNVRYKGQMSLADERNNPRNIPKLNYGGRRILKHPVPPIDPAHTDFVCVPRCYQTISPPEPLHLNESIFGTTHFPSLFLFALLNVTDGGPTANIYFLRSRFPSRIPITFTTTTNQ